MKNPGRTLALLTTLLAAGPAIAAPCDVTGTIHDAADLPVAGLDVRLGMGPSARRTTTDDAGRFAFPAVPEPTEVIVSLREGGEGSRFAMFEDGGPVQLRAAIDPAQGCTVSLGPDSSPPKATDLLALYRGLRRAAALGETLGVPRATPLRIEINDPAADPRAAFWVGPPSFNAEATTPVRIVLGTAATQGSDPGAPDNREYHEMGHHTLAAAFGALPRAHGNLDHGGYYQNPSSAVAWTEGFAIFFAAMVAREIEQRPRAGLYRVEGVWLDLELDYGPWDLLGRDSVAVASLLWDLVDGPRAATAAPTLTFDRVRLVPDESGTPLLVGRVHNPSASAVLHARVQVRDDAGFSAVTPVAPATLAPAADGWFALPLPDALAARDDLLDALTLEARLAPAADDDDALQVPLPELWAAITEFRSEHPDSNGRLLDVADLYQALRGRLGGRDADGDGRGDIDQLFIRHGLFADLDGDRTHDPDEALGLTSHPARTLEHDGQTLELPAMDPRRRLELPPGLRLAVALEPTDAEIVVVVEGSSWGGYVATPDAEGLIRLLPPPAASGATLTVIAGTTAHRPVILLRQTTTALLAELEPHREPSLEVSRTLPTGDPPGTTSAGSPRWPPVAFMGGAVAVLVGLVMMAIGWPRAR